MIRCMGPGGIGTESLYGDSREDDWRDVPPAQARRSSVDLMHNKFTHLIAKQIGGNAINILSNARSG